MKRLILLLAFCLSVPASLFAQSTLTVGIESSTQDRWTSTIDQFRSETGIQIVLHPYPQNDLAQQIVLQGIARRRQLNLVMARSDWEKDITPYLQDLSAYKTQFEEKQVSLMLSDGKLIGVWIPFAPEWFLAILAWPDDPQAAVAFLESVGKAEEEAVQGGPTGHPEATVASFQTTKIARSSHNPKVDGSLEALLEAVRVSISTATSGTPSLDPKTITGLPQAAKTAIGRVANQYGVSFSSTTATVTVVLKTQHGRSRAAVTSLASLGLGQVVETSTDLIRLSVPLNQLATIATQVTGIAFIRPPYIPYPLGVSSEGVTAIGAQRLHAAGITGNGVKVAIIDLGFSGLAQAQARGDLPSSVHQYDPTGTGLTTGITHGTAVAEIIYDVAPNAELHLIKIADEVDLDLAVTYCLNQKIDIINHSLGWYNTNFYDGTGTIAQIAKRAITGGILWVNAAGNEAESHWEGMFADGNGDSWNDQSCTFVVSGGDSVALYMTWDDWPQAASDYDLYLYAPLGQLVASSTKHQTGTEEPTESILTTSASPGMYTIRIKGAGSKKIELYSLHQNLSPAIAASSILAPANTTEVVTVGAIPYGQYETGPQEPYSSQGPTNNGRPKPDLCAPDQVATGTAPYTRFAGTSSAAPHVAGAAALLLAQNPSWTEPELRTHLLSETIPMGSPYIYGKGRLVLSLPAPPNQPPTASFTYLPPAPTVGTAVQFNANASHDPDGSIASYLWEFGDGATGSGITTQHTYISAKTYTVRLTVTDNMGASNVAQKAVSVIEAAKPDLLIESVAYSPLSPSVGQSITFTILIRNQGSAAAGSFRVKVQGAVLSTSRSIPQLAAATSTELSLSLPLTQARETFTVTVDDLEQVDEANEGNNSLEKTVEALIPQPLVADAGGPYAGAVGESIDFDGSGSSGAIKQYLWTFGDGSSGQGTHTSHTYNIPDTYTVTLTVTAEGGQHATDSTPVTISPPMGTLSVLLSLPKTSYAIGERITIQYTVNRAAFVYICDVDANGKTTLIFPSYLESNNWVQPGTHSLPSTGYLLQVSGPVGTETLYTFATTRPLPNFPTSFGRGFPVLSTDPPSFLANVRQTMQTQLPSGEWDEHTLSFAVVSTTPTPTTGTLSVTSSPSGASITIDGIPSGTTPKQISVSVGIHTVSFFLPGYQTATRQVTTTAGKVTPLYVPLVREIPNRPPVAAFTASPESPTVLQTIIFDGSTSYDSDGYVVSFTWDFGDGSGASNPVVSHNYSRASSYPVRLTVTDNLGSSHTSMKTIVVRPGSLPPPGGYPGSPPMGGIPGIFVWGTTTWHITINAGSTWTTSRAYRLELRTDGSFQNVNQSTSGGVAPMGIVPSPTQQGKSLLFEGSLQTGNVDYTFTSSAAGSIWMSLKLDIDGDGDLDESTGFIYLRNTMVHPPLGFLFSPGVPFAVKLAGEDVALLPSTNFYVCPSPVYEIKGTKLFLGCRRIKDLEGLP